MLHLLPLTRHITVLMPLRYSLLRHATKTHSEPLLNLKYHQQFILYIVPSAELIIPSVSRFPVYWIISVNILWDRYNQPWTRLSNNSHCRMSTAYPILLSFSLYSRYRLKPSFNLFPIPSLTWHLLTYHCTYLDPLLKRFTYIPITERQQWHLLAWSIKSSSHSS